jgi:hypothetical protein
MGSHGGVFEEVGILAGWMPEPARVDKSLEGGTWRRQTNSGNMREVERTLHLSESRNSSYHGDLLSQSKYVYQYVK